jgi:hypothetical protein
MWVYEIENNPIFYILVLEVSKDFLICKYKTMKENSLYTKYRTVVLFHTYFNISLEYENEKTFNFLLRFLKKFIK